MNDDLDHSDGKPRAATAAQLRQQRQAEALRANLARRKSQNRGRADQPDTAPESD